MNSPTSRSGDDDIARWADLELDVVFALEPLNEAIDVAFLAVKSAQQAIAQRLTSSALNKPSSVFGRGFFCVRRSSPRLEPTSSMATRGTCCNAEAGLSGPAEVSVGSRQFLSVAGIKICIVNSLVQADP